MMAWRRETWSRVVLLLDWAEETQAEAARVPKADRPSHRLGEAQEDPLTSAIPDERALVRFPSRCVHRYPLRFPPELNHYIRREPSALDLAADLIWDRLTRARLTTATIVSWRNVGRHCLPDL